MNRKYTGRGLTFSAVDAYGDPLEEQRPGWLRPYATDATSPFWYASGDEDDEEDEDDKGKGKEDDEDDEDEEDDDDEDKGKTPEELLAEVKRLRAAYIKKVKNSKNRGTRLSAAEAAKLKLETDYATLQEQFEDLKKTAGKEVDSEAATRRINELIEKAKEDGKNAFKPTVIKMAARAEFMAQGARPALVDRLVRMIDVNDVDIDDEDGTIDVTDQILAIKKDLPEMFGPKRSTTTKRTTRKTTDGDGDGKNGARKAGAGGGGDEGAGGGKKLTSAERIANRLRGITE